MKFNRLSGFMGNAGVLLRAYVYARMLGAEGMHRVADFATLNANPAITRSFLRFSNG